MFHLKMPDSHLSQRLFMGKSKTPLRNDVAPQMDVLDDLCDLGFDDSWERINTDDDDRLGYDDDNMDSDDDYLDDNFIAERNLVAASSSYITKDHNSRLRPIVIDGSNVACAHGKSEPSPKNRRNGWQFSCLGIKLVVEYFLKRGHDHIVAFVPEFRKKRGKSQDGHVLKKLEEEGHLVFTPSREVGGRSISSNDDRYILGHAAKHGGIVVTRDNFRNYYHEPEWRETIEKRLLQPTFFRGELFDFPEDPMGKNGVSLDQFLKF